MNKLLYTVLLITLSIKTSIAQKEWSVSPTLGVNMVPYFDERTETKPLKPGISFGALTGPVFNDHWRLNFGLIFNQRYTYYYDENEIEGLDFLSDILGNVIEGIEVEASEINETRTDYWTVDIPITLEYNFKSGFFLHAGVYLNSLISVSSKNSYTTHIPILEVVDPADYGLGLLNLLIPINTTEVETSNSTDGMSPSDAGFIGGFGTENGNFRIKLQYQYGFTDIRNDNFNPGVSNQQAISFHIAYLFYPSFETSNLKPKYDLELIK